MKSESIGAPLARYRWMLRRVRSKWLLALAVGAAGSGVYAANVLATTTPPL